MTVVLTALAMWMRSCRIGHHQAAVVLHHRRLPGAQRVRLRPSQAQTNAEIAALGGTIAGARVFRDVQPRNADPAGRARGFHQLIEHGRWFVLTALPLRLEANAIDGAIHFGHAQNLFDAFADAAPLREVNRFAPE